ncbi:hypothetical protein XBJ2_1300032 [Xenorhabdus bovienii str. Jollieti]|uniref:Uncharacterized protein n=1 Tax=Xenorhabdus bovienii (strain SS-2004) TaxID=406818 RepID=D3V1P2_XENBS|nr:hypothetical protein XBJ1_2462 [Xenorhabdus bovienii SS-2004]CDH27481.1 hypothetical protein XBJ2_1300032 [Xenorhabdus bovienii str. Jollieti]
MVIIQIFNKYLYNPSEAESPYIKTQELAARCSVKPHTIRLWCGNGKQRRESFPKPN